MPRLHLVPADTELFELLEGAGANLRRVGELLARLLTEWPDAGTLCAEIQACEQRGDRITHGIIDLLHGVSVAPIDRADLLSLATALDDVVDFADEVADYLGIYGVEAPMEAAQELARVLREACAHLHDALTRLPDLRGLDDSFTEVRRLEDEGDEIVRAAVASLFTPGIDPTVIIRWKDLYERLEQAIDACKTVVHILEGIVVKRP